jgi:hypothetical protein
MLFRQWRVVDMVYLVIQVCLFQLPCILSSEYSMGSTVTHTKMLQHFISEHIWIIDMYDKCRLLNLNSE